MSNTKPRRWAALDVLRAGAVVLMVQGHTFRALLDENVQRAPLYRLHDLLHGLVAPAFLVGAGLAFGAVGFAQWKHDERGPALLTALRRPLFLIALGYAIQLPSLSLTDFVLGHTSEPWVALRVGPLHVVGASLAVCVLLRAGLVTRARFVLACGALFTLITFGAQPLWQAHAARVFPAVLAAWVDGETHSDFPLLPWSAFVFGGVVLAHFVDAKPRAAWLGLGGLAMALLTWGIWYAGFRPGGRAFFWESGAQHTLFRASVIVAVLGLLAWLVPDRDTPSPLVRACMPLARHSLVAYVVHLLVLWGTPFTPNIAARFGPTLDLAHTLVATAAVLGATVLSVLLWDRVRGTRSRAFDYLRATLASVFVLLLLIPR